MSETAAVAGSTGLITVRKARLSDVKPLVAMINAFASQGIMLPRTEFELAENVRDFTVVLHDGEVAGCGALHFYGLRTGEIRSLAVLPVHQHLGIGKRLIEALEQEAAEHGLVSVFAFTYIPAFFAKLGYEEVDRRLLPAKVWKDCLRCPKLQCCDEIAVRKLLAPEEAVAPAEDAQPEPGNGALVLPVVGTRKAG
jgi:amino-acid N-acetyltransferase